MHILLKDNQILSNNIQLGILMESIRSTMGKKNISLAKKLNANIFKNVVLNQLLPKYPADISIP